MKKHLQAGKLILNKRDFFFDVKENQKGKYLRITERSGGRSSIVVPLGGINAFNEELGGIIEDVSSLIEVKTQSIP